MKSEAGQEFGFSPAKDTVLEHNSRGFFLISKAPIRTLRINQSLFSILEQIQAGISLSEIIRHHPTIRYDQLLHILISLVYRGYYRLEKIPELKDYPSISIIIPVRNPDRNLIECLDSITALDYPQEKLEVLVVEDGPAESNFDYSRYKIQLIRLSESQGPGTARNTGAQQATGEILAFLDADCMADKNWLREIIPFFQAEGIGAAGGFVGGYYRTSLLDHYEEASSSLNLGPRLLIEGNTRSVLYVPTCNLLIKNDAFFSAGGFRDGMRIGEDVDFCWRLRKQGQALLYVPVGKAAHKHRNQLTKMLRRRMEYGTSEAVLYRTHRDKKKQFFIPIWAGSSFLAATLAILLLNPYLLGLVLLCFSIDLAQKWLALKKNQHRFSFREIRLSTLRSHFSFYYYTTFHLVRYYLLLLLAAGFLYHPIWYFGLLAGLLASIVDFLVKKPRLVYPVFGFYYLLEHAAYQIGVFWGCLKLRYFGSYLPVFSRKIKHGGK